MLNVLRSFRTSIALAALLAVPVAVSAVGTPSASRSSVSVVVENGVVLVVVTVVDETGAPLGGKGVVVQSDNSGVTFVAGDGSTTNTSGHAEFPVSLGVAGTVRFTANADGVAIIDDAQHVFGGETGGVTTSPVPGPGSLIKLACPPNAGVSDSCKEVSYVGLDGARHSFPNQAVFFTWYPGGFSSVSIQTVTPSVLVSFPLGRNVTHRPGVRLIKSPSNPSVYAATKGDASYGLLRPITDPAVAIALYGNNWARSVTDFSDVFMLNSYRFGPPIASVGDYSLAAEQSANVTIDAAMGR